MADPTWAAFSFGDCRPISQWEDDGHFAMIEFLFIYQLARNPMQAVARRWWCRGLYRASRGRRRCPECSGL
jgi:hypothetical protein